MTGLFTILEGETVVLTSGGTYYQKPLFTRGGYLYAAWGQGFVRLLADGVTTRPKLRVNQFCTTMPVYRDNIGRLSLTQMPGSKLLSDLEVSS